MRAGTGPAGREPGGAPLELPCPTVANSAGGTTRAEVVPLGWHASNASATAARTAGAQEFAEYARGADLADPTPGVAPLELPYAVEGDRVGGLTVKLMFNKDARWSRALKYLLTDLKWCLSWAVARLDGQRPAPGGGGAPGALPADDA